MKLLKRLLFIIVILPIFLLSFAWWVLVGKEPIELLDKFIKWCIYE